MAQDVRNTSIFQVQHFPCRLWHCAFFSYFWKISCDSILQPMLQPYHFLNWTSIGRLCSSRGLWRWQRDVYSWRKNGCVSAHRNRIGRRITSKRGCCGRQLWIRQSTRQRWPTRNRTVTQRPSLCQQKIQLKRESALGPRISSLVLKLLQLHRCLIRATLVTTKRKKALHIDKGLSQDHQVMPLL